MGEGLGEGAAGPPGDNSIGGRWGWGLARDFGVGLPSRKVMKRYAHRLFAISRSKRFSFARSSRTPARSAKGIEPRSSGT